MTDADRAALKANTGILDINTGIVLYLFLEVRDGQANPEH